jgi:hypothetical protein
VSAQLEQARAPKGPGTTSRAAKVDESYWEIIGDNLKPSRLELGAMSQPLIPTGEKSGLLTRIAMTETGSSCGPMKS